MSLQDNIFDVEHALEGRPELKLFEEIMTRFAELERREEEYFKVIGALNQTASLMQAIWDGKLPRDLSTDSS